MRLAIRRLSVRPQHDVPVKTLRLDRLYRLACYVGISDDHHDQFALGTSAGEALGTKTCVTMIHTSSQHTWVVDKRCYTPNLLLYQRRSGSEPGEHDERTGRRTQFTYQSGMDLLDYSLSSVSCHLFTHLSNLLRVSFVNH